MNENVRNDSRENDTKFLRCDRCEKSVIAQPDYWQPEPNIKVVDWLCPKCGLLIDTELMNGEGK